MQRLTALTVCLGIYFAGAGQMAAAAGAVADPLDSVAALVTLAIFFGLPAWIALGRGHHQKWAIVATVILLGWTGLGWIVALIWSVGQVRRDAAA